MLLKAYCMQKTELMQLRRTVEQLTVELAARNANNISPRNTVSNGNNANSCSRRPVNSLCTRSCMDTTASTPLSTSSASSSSLVFDEMDPALSNNTTSNNDDMNIPFFPLDTQLQPPMQSQIQPQQQLQLQQPHFNADQVNILSADDTYGYRNSLTDWSWSCGMDMDSLGLSLGLDTNNKGFEDLMNMATTGTDPTPSKNSNPNDMCFGWNYLGL